MLSHKGFKAILAEHLILDYIPLVMLQTLKKDYRATKQTLLTTKYIN